MNDVKEDRPRSLRGKSSTENIVRRHQHTDETSLWAEFTPPPPSSLPWPVHLPPTVVLVQTVASSASKKSMRGLAVYISGRSSATTKVKKSIRSSLFLLSFDIPA